MSLELVHEIALRWKNRFFNCYLKSCVAQQLPWLNSSTVAHRTRCKLLRANHSHGSEIAECFVLLSVVYHDGTFKMTPLTLWNPPREITPEIRYKSSQNGHE